MVFDMNKLILPLFLALIVATTVMATPLIFAQPATRQTSGEFISPGSADQKNTDTTPAGAAQTQTDSKTLETISITGTNSLLNVFYMLAIGIFIASFTTLIVIRTQRRLL